MQEEQQETTSNYTWGMPRGLYQEVKYYGVPIAKAGFVVMVFIISLQLSGPVFPPDQPLQFILCVILNTLLALYLILPTRAGGTNAMAIFYFHFKRKKRYYSVDRNAYPEMKEVRRKRRKLKGVIR